jgi:phosphatidylserine/phosphatidylglycerophosphate/cardiolipin synthase-like enzyme
MEKQNVRGTGSVFPLLQKAKVDIVPDGNCYIMHHKSIVIDTSTVITGSYNFTKSAEKSNDENLLIITSEGVAAQFLTEYDRVRERADAPQVCKS